MPLVSIGLSSFLAPALAIGLMLALPRIERQGNQA
jgi:cell division protein FtsW (lipid II flippase)